MHQTLSEASLLNMTKEQLIKLALSQEKIIERFEQDHNAMQLFYETTNYRYKVQRGWQ